MSTRYEGAGADTDVDWEKPGDEIGELTLPPGNYALTICYDEVFYIQGTPEELRRFMVRFDEQLQAIEAHSQEPLGYGDIRTDEEGDYICPRCDTYWSPRDQGDLFSLVAEVKAHIDDKHPAVKS